MPSDLLLNEDSIAYLTGNTIIIQNLDTNEQWFVHASKNNQIIGLVASVEILVDIEEPKQRPFVPTISIFNHVSLQEGPVYSFDVPIEESFASISTIHRQKITPLCMQKRSIIGCSFVANI